MDTAISINIPYHSPNIIICISILVINFFSIRYSVPVCKYVVFIWVLMPILFNGVFIMTKINQAYAECLAMRVAYLTKRGKLL